MFERNKVDTNEQRAKTAIPVEVQLDGGERIKGKFLITSTRSVFDVLNSAEKFIEFEPYGGERELIAKTQLLSIKIIKVPAPRSLTAHYREIDGFEPYAILGVERGAPWEDVREAYRALSKIYHPDRYASASLPGEVTDYLNAMFRRITAAFSALDKPQQTQKRRQENAPVYTSPSRA